MLKPVAAHLADVAGLVRPRPVVHVPLAEALGLVLAQDVVTDLALPSFASSAMDGYAVRVSDVPGVLRVVGDVPAGRVPEAVVEVGCAVRVMTGAMLPEGTEAVVPVEHTDGGTSQVSVREPAQAGAYLRAAGSDLPPGAVVVSAGTRVTSARVAALASVGVLHPLVHPAPRVLVVSTGDELVDPGVRPGAAQLVDSNRPALLAAVAESGCLPVDGGRWTDDPTGLLAHLDRDDVDLVITSGGVSVGAYDVVKAALRDVPGIVFDKVAVQPGMPQAWGRLPKGAAYLGLPGNPVSALVSWEVFARAALGQPRQRVPMRLAVPLVGSPPDKLQLVRMTLTDDGLVPVDAGGSHLLAGLARADVLALVPAGVSDLPAGATVETIVLDACAGLTPS